MGDDGLVVGIDHIPELVEQSIKNIEADSPELLHHCTVIMRVADGFGGYPDLAPYDAIHVGAAAPTVPRALVDQLKTGGRLVVPVGEECQRLMLFDKLQDGSLREKVITFVRYVPLTTQDKQMLRW